MINSNNKLEECKKLLMTRQLVPLLSIKDIIAGSVYTVLPWTIILILVAFIILV